MSAFNVGNLRWCLTVLAVDANETMGNGHSMDGGMDFSKEVVRQRRRSTVVAAAGD